MEVLDNDSELVAKSELEIFSSRPTQAQIKKGFWDEIQLANSLTDTGPYSFRLPADPNMLKIYYHWIRLVIRIKRANGNDLRGREAVGEVAAIPYDNVGPINAIGKTFFKNVEVRIGGRVVYHAQNTYAYRAWFETELNYGTDAKYSHLQACLYYRDQEGEHDLVDNAGFQSRAEWFRNSRQVELFAPIHVDLFEQEKYLLSMMEMNIELERHDDRFVLMCPGENPQTVEQYRIQVDHMSLFVRRAEIHDDIANFIQNNLNNDVEAKYPIRRIRITNLHVGQGRWGTPTTALFTGQIPRRVFVGCVKARAFTGDYTLNPFNFLHMNIKSAKVVAAGQTYPEPPYALNIPNGEYLRAYLGLHDALGIERDNRGIGLDRRSFVQGYTILGFDLTPDSDDGPHWNPVKDGTFSVHLEFAEPVSEPNGIEVIVLAEYDNIVYLNKLRVPRTDYVVG